MGDGTSARGGRARGVQDGSRGNEDDWMPQNGKTESASLADIFVEETVHCIWRLTHQA